MTAKGSDPAYLKTVPKKMREYTDSVTTNLDSYTLPYPVNMVSITSDVALYISLGGDAITGYDSATVDNKALRLSHPGGGSTKVYPQEDEFKVIYHKAVTTSGSITITPGAFIGGEP